MKRICFVFLTLVIGGNLSVYAQSIPSPQNLPYSQDFSSTVHSTTTYPVGWMGWTIGTSPSTTYSTSAPIADRVLLANSSASTNTGNVHNYNGKIGMLNTGALDLALVLCVNTSGKKNILLQYDAMTLRNPYDTTTNNRIHELGLQYRVGSIGIFTNLIGISYTNNTVKQTSSGVTSPQNLQSKSIVLPADCDNKDSVQIRWLSKQISGSGLRPSFAIDNIKIDTAAVMSPIFIAHAAEAALPNDGRMKIELSAAPSKTTVFKYDISGTATFNIDYTTSITVGTSTSSLSAATGSISIDSGVSSLYINFHPINDALVEGMETIQYTISEALTGYALKDSSVLIHLVDDELSPIHLIQGNGATAKAGTYNVAGIVTAVFPLLSPRGFYVQEEDADADSDINSSEGIFVVSDSILSIGDKVEILGDAYEGPLAPSYGQASMTISRLQKISSANPLPTASVITLPLAMRSDLEKYEGMLVRFADTLTVSDNDNLGKYGEVSLSAGGVVYQPTQIIDPNDALASGTKASGASNVGAISAQLRANDLRTVLLDDGRASSMPTLPYVNSDNTLRVGSAIDSLWGVMGFAYDQYRVQPTVLSAVKISHQLRPSVPNVGADANIKIASFNVLNYFNGDGFGGGFPTSRGASSLAEFSRQRDKIIKAIIALDADIVGLIEIENDGIGSSSAIQNLVNGVNAYLGAGIYSIVADGDTIQRYNTDAIRCGMIYKTAVLDTIGVVMTSADTVFNRPPLAQTFKVRASDSVFVFIINHFKAKGCAGSKGLDKDQFDGQSCYNERRKQQAAALTSFINKELIPTCKTDKLLSMGDYNSYFEEDPLDTLRSVGFQVLSKATTYSFLYQGQLGSLDNAFSTSSLLPFITGIEKWNINSVEPSYLDYEDDINDGAGDQVNFWSFLYSDAPYRCSDHDPVLVGLKLGKKLSIKNQNQGFDFEMYPNPVKDKLVVFWNDKQEVNLEIFNCLGQKVLFFENLVERTIIDVQPLSSGIYYLELRNNRGASLMRSFLR
jgi:predicted extracellular nuclease